MRKIEELAEEAIEKFLTEGTHPLSMILEFERTTHIVEADFINDHLSTIAQNAALARYTWELCHEEAYAHQAILSISLSSEAWLPSLDASLEEYIRPNLDSQKREVLIITQWQANRNPPVETHILPVLRDKKKRITRIVFSPEDVSHKSTYFIDAVLHGIADAKIPDNEVIRHHSANIFSILDRLSPEERFVVKKLLHKEMPESKRILEDMGFF